MKSPLSASAASRKPLDWRASLWLLTIALILVVMTRSDFSQLEWVSRLAQEGSPPPAQDPKSPTGYALGQRNFLGTHERGETYRWIAATQDFIAAGPFASPIYEADTVPEGRPQLMPRLYTSWLAAISWGLHFITGDPIGISVERAALWEPVISHVLAFLAVLVFMWARFGRATAVVTALFFACFPPVLGQFLPGVLTARTWALFLSAYAVALILPQQGNHRTPSAFSVRSALAAGTALWLDPAFGFPAVLISAAVGAGMIYAHQGRAPYFKWSLIGSSVTLVGWLIDHSPWNPASGELRYVHPLYALAWLGVGLALDGGQDLREGDRPRKRSLAEVAIAIPLWAALISVQLGHGYKAWLYPSAAMRRLTSLDETSVFATAMDWFANASVAEVTLISAPVLAAIVALVPAGLRKRRPASEPEPARLVAAVLLASVLALAFCRIRWGVIASLVALPVICHLVAAWPVVWRRGMFAVTAALCLGLIGCRQRLPESLRQPSLGKPPRAADLEALVNRHFSHWLASHNPGQKISALAPPELSDSLVFHGGCHVLISTAWESYPGQIAASRILSAPEASEAEAVLQGREITHVILSSWDKVLPLLVREPKAEGQDTLYARLQRWVYPAYLRPIPYRLPSTPGFLDQKLVVFKVVPPQDEALALSRLAEYFVEMNRDEPAGLAATVLAESYPDDPDAAIARALVYAHTHRQTDFNRELARLASDVSAGKSPSSWERRVQRAVVLALGHRRELAQAEVEACVASASGEALFELTPLEAYRLRALATQFEVAWPDASLARLLASLGAEFSS